MKKEILETIKKYTRPKDIEIMVAGVISDDIPELKSKIEAL